MNLQLNRFCGVCDARDTIQCEPLVLEARCLACSDRHAVCAPCMKRLKMELIHFGGRVDEATSSHPAFWPACPDAVAVADALMAEDE